MQAYHCALLCSCRHAQMLRRCYKCCCAYMLLRLCPICVTLAVCVAISLALTLTLTRMAICLAVLLTIVHQQMKELGVAASSSCTGSLRPSATSHTLAPGVRHLATRTSAQQTAIYAHSIHQTAWAVLG